MNKKKYFNLSCRICFSKDKKENECEIRRENAEERGGLIQNLVFLVFANFVFIKIPCLLITCIKMNCVR